MNPAERRDPFDVLGLPGDATEEAVKSAYRRLAKAVHPDSTGAGDHDRFREVHEAYRTLLDPAGREAARKLRRERPPSLDRSDVQAAFDGVFDGFVEAPKARDFRRRQGVDVERRLEIDVGQAMSGGRHVLRHASGPCTVCGGGGRLRTSVPGTCPDCEGIGSVTRSLGMVSAAKVCRTCMGRGVAALTKCSFCGGDGNVAGAGVEVVLPPGIRSGTKVAVAGAGAPGSGGGRPGDLVVEVVVTMPKSFLGHGDDVEISVAVDVWDAALGATVEVPTVSGGTVAVVMSPGTQPGTEVVLEGQGMPMPNGRRGRMTVVFEVVVPDGSVEPYRGFFSAMRAAKA